jgi:hypothetical protein
LSLEEKVMNRLMQLGLISTLLFVSPAAAFAQGVAVYHSPDDSGTNVGLVDIASSGTTTLHIYMDGGTVASAGPDPCCTGQGDEILGWDFSLGAADGLSIGAAAPLGDVIVNQSPTLLSMNGGDFQVGDLGPTKIADVDVQTTGNGSLSLIFGQVVGPSLGIENVDPMTIVGVPEPSVGLLLIVGVAGLAGIAPRSHTQEMRKLD